MDDGLAEAVEGFCMAAPKYGTAKGAFSQCRAASKSLARHLGKLGFQAKGLRLAECSARYPDADGRWKRLGAEFWWIHYAVLVGDTVCDVTMRQFAPDAPFPSLSPLEDVLEGWGSVEFVDLGTGEILGKAEPGRAAHRM